MQSQKMVKLLSLASQDSNATEASSSEDGEATVRIAIQTT